MIYKAVPPAPHSPRSMCCWHPTRKHLFLQSKGPATGSPNQVGWLSFTQRKNYKGEKRRASTLQKVLTADQSWFPMFLKSRAPISTPCHAEAQITRAFLAAAGPSKECTDFSFLKWPSAWDKFLFIPLSWGFFFFFFRTPQLVLAIRTSLAMVCY